MNYVLDMLYEINKYINKLESEAKEENRLKLRYLTDICAALNHYYMSNQIEREYLICAYNKYDKLVNDCYDDSEDFKKIKLLLDNYINKFPFLINPNDFRFYDTKIIDYAIRSSTMTSRILSAIEKNKKYMDSNKMDETFIACKTLVYIYYIAAGNLLSLFTEDKYTISDDSVNRKISENIKYINLLNKYSDYLIKKFCDSLHSNPKYTEKQKYLLYSINLETKLNKLGYLNENEISIICDKIICPNINYLIEVRLSNEKDFNVTESMIRQFILDLITENNDDLYKKYIYNFLKKSVLYETNFETMVEEIKSEIYHITEDYFNQKHEDDQNYIYKNIMDNNIICNDVLDLSVYMIKVLQWLEYNPNDEFNDMINHFNQFIEYIKDVFIELKVNKFIYRYNYLQIVKSVFDSQNKLNLIVDVNKYKKIIKDKYDLDLELIKSNNKKGKDWVENIIRGEVLYDTIRNTPEFNNYSDCIQNWCACVENMLKDKIADKLSNTKNDKLKKLFSNFCFEKCTLGSYKILWDLHNNDFVDKLYKKYIFEELNFKGNIDNLNNFFEKVNELTKYRNRSAHGVYCREKENNIVKDIVFISTKIIKILSEL